MSMSDPLNHLGSIWCHSEPLEFPYSPKQFLGWDFFAVSYSKPALEMYEVDSQKFNIMFEVDNSQKLLKPIVKEI